VRTGNIINEACARELVGKSFLGGTFVSHETRGGKTTLTAKCNQCGGPHSGISVTNADQAVRNPNSRLIGCQHCSFVSPTAATQKYEDVIRIPERDRTSAQDRIVAEHEFAVRKAQAERVNQAPILAARVQANRAIKSAMWDARERFLTALAHLVGAQTISDPRVETHESYQTWEQWQGLSDEVREETNRWTDVYFANHGLR
jgi:hypothetical protein